MANLVNVVGINNLGGSPKVVNPAQLNAPQMPQIDVSSYPEYAQQQDITDAKYAQIRQDKEREYQAYIDQINASGVMKQSEMMSKGVNKRTAGVGAVLSTVGTALLDWYGKDQEKKTQQQQEQQRLTAFEARKALEDVFNQAQSRLLEMGDTEGMFTIEQDMNKVLQQHTDLPPDLLEPLYEWSGSTLRDIQRNVATRQREQAEEMRNATINSTASLLQAEVTPFLVQMADGRMSQDQLNTQFDQVFQWLVDKTADYDPTMRFRIIAPVLDSMRESLTEGSREYMAVTQRVADMNAAFAEIEQGRNAYGNNPTGWEYFLWGLGAKYPSVSDLIAQVPNNLELYSTYSGYEEQRARNAERQLQQYRQQQQERNMRPADLYEMSTAVNLAYTMYQGGVSGVRELTRIQRLDESDRTPADANALEIYNRWTDSRTQLQELQQQLRRAQETYVKTVDDAGEPRTTIDPVTGRQVPLLDENGNQVYTNLTQREIDAAYLPVQDLEGEISNLIKQTYDTLGINLADPNDRSGIDAIINQAQAAARAEETRPALIEGAGLAPPGSLTQPRGGEGTETPSVNPSSPRAVLRRAGIPGFNWGLDDDPPGYQIQVPPVNRLSRISDPTFGNIPIPIADNVNGGSTVQLPQINNVQIADTNYRRGRTTPINRVVIHETVGNLESTINTFQDPAREASYNYVIDLNGNVTQFVPDEDTAYGAYGANEGSIHISLESPNPEGTESYTDAQYNTLNQLIAAKGWAGLPMVSHQEVDTTGERFDPRGFDWSRLNPSALVTGGAPSPNRNITVTSEYGMRSIFGEHRMHWGIDIDTGDLYDRDTGAVAMSGGYVVGVEDANGYGGTVAILTGEGYTEQYNHLRRFFVRPGDFVAPGTPLGLIGGDPSDPMAGQTTGRHLHFQVWKPGYDWTGQPSEESTIDPLAYLARIQTVEPIPDGIGAPPLSLTDAYIPTPNTLPFGNGNFASPVPGNEYPALHAFLESIQLPASWLYGASPTQTRGNVNPAPSALAPIQRDAYPSRNDPTANYGYQVLADDPEFARALAETSDRLNIPAQWLADVMAAESSFDPHVINQIGAEGLIQFVPYYNPGLGYSEGEVAAMDRATQTRTLVYEYLAPFVGRINSIEDLYEAIYSGDITGDPGYRSSLGDGQSSFYGQIESFGNSVGRRYRSTNPNNLQSSIMHVHDEPDPNCPVCQQQLNHFGSIIPHEALVS